jgi:hypothetical protein
MANKPYREAYEAAASELEALVREHERIEVRILSLRKSMNALAQLISEHEGKDVNFEDYAHAQLREVIDTSLTADIRRIMTASGDALTTTDVREELNKLGGSMAEQINPLATINAILNRLEEQGYVREELKGGRKAWRRIPYAQRHTVGQKVLRGHRANVAEQAKKK